jgi:hypothetical protein
MRNYRGVDYNSGYPDAELTLDNIQHILTPEILKTIEHVNFNGNLGDFSLAKDGAEIVQYLVAHDITVGINTNGSLRPKSWWQKLASPQVTIGFALDGLADTHAVRINGTFNTVWIASGIFQQYSRGTAGQGAATVAAASATSGRPNNVISPVSA